MQSQIEYCDTKLHELLNIDIKNASFNIKTEFVETFVKDKYFTMLFSNVYCKITFYHLDIYDCENSTSSVHLNQSSFYVMSDFIYIDENYYIKLKTQIDKNILTSFIKEFMKREVINETNFNYESFLISLYELIEECKFINVPNSWFSNHLSRKK